jgi:Sporulation and spore germination
MERRILLRLAGLGATAGGLSACGIASHDSIVVDGAGPAPVRGGQGSSVTRPIRSDGRDWQTLLLGFFAQPAGDDGPDQALNRCRNYLKDDAFRAYQEQISAIAVVWIDEEQLDSLQPTTEGLSQVVPVDMYELGTLANNQVQPRTAAKKYTAEFHVTPSSEARPTDLYITQINGAVPGKMMLSSSALASYYAYRNLYFYSRTAPDELVPDPRYVYQGQDTPPHRQMIEMLTDGPSGLLAGITQGLLPGMKLKDTPTIDGGRIVVNLSQPAPPKELDQNRLVAQLSWTLLTEVTALTSEDRSPIQLKVESVVKAEAGQSYQDRNPAAVRHLPTQMFGLFEGKVKRLRFGTTPTDRPVTFIDQANLNQYIEEAACVATNDDPEEIAALAVVRREAGHPRLYVYPKTDSSAEGRLIAFSDVEEILRPTFVDSDNLLVVAHGALYHVVRTDSRPRRVATPGIPGKIKALALSPERRRLALVTEAGLFLAPLSHPASGGISIADGARPVPTVMTGLNGVGFTGEALLVVAGVFKSRPEIMTISIDGALIGKNGHVRMTDRSLPDITSLMAYPDNPSPRQPSDTSRVVFTANKIAYEPPKSDLSPETRQPGKPIKPFIME